MAGFQLMFLQKHSSYNLRLAIVAAILGSTQSTAIASQPWNCREINGQWDCSASSDTLESEDTSILFTDDNAFIHSDAPKKSVSNEPYSPSKSANASLVTKNRDTNNDIKSETEKHTIETSSLTESINDTAEQQIQTKADDYSNTQKELTENTKSSPQTAVQLAPTSVAKQTTPITTLKNTASKVESKDAVLSDNLTTIPRLEKTAVDFKNLDWYPYTDQDTARGACKGRYISPEIITDSQDDTPIDLQTVFVSADQSATEIGKESTLKGNVDFQQGNKSFHSPLAKLNQESGAYSLENGVTFRQPGLLITGTHAEGNINEEETRLHNAKYVAHQQHIRGDAKVMVRKTKSELEIEQGTYTFCPPGNEDWKISADKISLDTEAGFGKAEHAKLKLFGATVFYAPVFYFPLDDRRHSGFLYPSFKLSDSQTQVAIPYYFNIAPNIDDTLTATVFSDTGLLLENELRYLDKNSTNRLSLGFLAVDNSDDDNSGRWVAGINHTGRYGKYTTVIDYTEVSDNDYFDDLDTNLDVDQGDNDHINQTAKVSYQADTWQSSVLLQKYQTIDDDTTKPYQRLPEFRISGSPKEDFDNLSINYRGTFTRFDRDITGLTDTDRIVGDRVIFNPSISADYSKTWGYLKPAVKLWHASYNLDNQVDGAANNPSVTVPILEVDSGLYFDRDFTFQDTGYTQTLEPRLYGLYVPYQDQSDLPDFDTSELTFTYDSLFRDNRFSGDDRIGDTKQISLGLTTRVLSDKGSEILAASIGHAFYFDDRKVRVDADDDALDDNESDFATAITWRPNKRLRTTFDATFDADSFTNSEMTLDVQYEKDTNNVYGFRHRFTEDVRKQTTISYLSAINETWSTLGLVQYDWLDNEVIDTAIGLEYESCCWKTRLVVRNELESGERDTTIALQFVLQGLGGFGKSPTTELRDKIKGYEQREYYNANNNFNN
jgi:LPS-assembly protein